MTDPAKPPETINWTQKVSDSEVYRFLVTQWIHQNQLSWSRTQTIVAIEAGLLTAAFTKKGLIAVFTLILGSLILLLIWRLIQRDWEVRDQNLKILDHVHELRGIKMIKEPRNRWWRGAFILKLIMYIILLVNTILAIAFAFLVECSLFR